MLNATPSTLGYPSKQKLSENNGPISEAINALDHFEFRAYDPSGGATSGQKGRRASKACELCAKKHAKCHGELPDIVCTMPKCTCLFHNPTQEQSPSSPDLTYQEDTPSTVVIRRPGLIPTRHFAGETSYILCFQRSQPELLVEEIPISTPPNHPLLHRLSLYDEKYLIDVYCDNASPYFPLVNKSDLYEQYNKIMQEEPCYLSPLFFFALFARAAYIADRIQAVDGRNFKEVGDQYLEYAIFLRSYYQSQPSISTVLALVILANHLEQKKCYNGITQSWILSGEAFRMAIDSGLHRMCSLNESNARDQLCIRAFWLAYVTDCTISLCYGRPSAVEEKLLDVVLPSVITDDADLTKYWVQALGEIVTFSKIAVRIVRFNFSPPPPFLMDGPIKRHNAFLASMDSWLTDLRYPLNERAEEADQSFNCLNKRLVFQKNIFFLIDLILLHRPYCTGTKKSNPSLEICLYAAAEIIYSSHNLDNSDLTYHSSSSMLAYALAIALQIQVTNAAEHTDSKYDSNVCELGITVLSKLPQCQNSDSILLDVLNDLREHFLYRRPPLVFKDQPVYISQKVPKQSIPAVEFIFGPRNTPAISADPETSRGDNRPSLKYLPYCPSEKKNRNTPPKKNDKKLKQRNQKKLINEAGSSSNNTSTTQSPPRLDNTSPPNSDNQNYIAFPNDNPVVPYYDPSIYHSPEFQAYQAYQAELYLIWCTQNGINPLLQQGTTQMDHLADDVENVTMTESWMDYPNMNTSIYDYSLSELRYQLFYFQSTQDFVEHETEHERVREYYFGQEEYNNSNSQQQQQQQQHQQQQQQHQHPPPSL